MPGARGVLPLQTSMGFGGKTRAGSRGKKRMQKDEVRMVGKVAW